MLTGELLTQVSQAIADGITPDEGIGLFNGLLIIMFGLCMMIAFASMGGSE